jgi:hypothetical protein
MSTARRGFLSRIGIRRSPALPPVVERFDLRISIDNYVDDDDAASIRTLLPAYSPRSNRPQPMLPQQFLCRPPSPTPTYYSVDEPETPPPEMTTHHHPNDVNHITEVDPLSIVDDIVNRLQESLKNPRSWRVLGNGEKSFFWALRCAPGTADILNSNISEIRSRIMGTQDWRMQKCCVIFRGQKLGDLWCRPIHTQVGFVLSFFADLPEIWNSYRSVDGRLFCYSCI